MKGLLKADFRRVRKDKLLPILGILAVAFAVFLPLLYAVVFSGAGFELDDMTAAMISGLVSGKGLFFNAFSMGNNLGLIVPVLLAIILCKDFSYGTIRNKIIAGKSRSAIYLSLLVTCAVVLVAVILLHAFLTLGVSLLFFDYQPTPFTIRDLWYFLESLAFELLVLLFMAAMLSWLCASMKNLGLVIVLYVAITLASVMIGGILPIVLGVLEFTEDNNMLIRLLTFFNRINVGSAVSFIGTGTQYSTKDVLYLTVPPLLGILGFTGMGLLTFRKKDLK